MIKITLTNELCEEEQKIIKSGLSAHNKQFCDKYESKSLQLILKDKDMLIGGIYGVFISDALFINGFWVDEAYRDKGLGTFLLNYVEKMTIEHQLDYILIHALDETLKNFYLNRHFQVTGYLDDRPIGHRYYFLEKRIKNNVFDVLECPKDFTLVNNPKEIEIDLLNQKIEAGKEALVGTRLFKFLYVTAKNSDNELIGGLIGYLGYDYLYISSLWVHVDYRNNQLGKKLVIEAEQHALTHKIEHAFLGTNDFQAKPFYEKWVIKSLALTRIYQ